MISQEMFFSRSILRDGRKKKEWKACSRRSWKQQIQVEQDPRRGQEGRGFLARGWRLSSIVRGRKVQTGLGRSVRTVLTFTVDNDVGP